MNSNRIFLTEDNIRLRAGWRLLIQSLGSVFTFACFGIPFVLLFFFLDPASALAYQLTPTLLLLSVTVETLAITTSVFLARRFLDKQSIESLGLRVNRQALLDVLMGICITFLQMGFIFAVLLSLGWLKFEGFAWQFDPINTVISSVLTFFIVFIFVGWNEELLARGYQLQNIASGINLFWGVVISSAIFGLLHIGNPSATWVSTAGIFFAGVFLAYGYVCTRQLWLPIGLHIGWNFFEGVVFGFPVSGLDIYALTRIEVTGPELWTGGAFGPEAGLIVLPSLVVGAGLIYLFTRNRMDTSHV